MPDAQGFVTVHEARKARAELEQRITEMLNQFVLKTGVTIEGISLMPNPVLGQFRYLVKLDTKI